jgi:pSer/pThr/pTyr-binding forkhead associated (FHA) protein
MRRNSEDLPILVAQTGPLDGQRWMVKDIIIMGRDDACDIIVSDRQVSRYHARLTPAADGVLLEDMGSKNGTHCNGKLITDIVTLHDGDVIQIALAQQFVYLSSDATLPLDSPLQESNAFNKEEHRLRLDKRSRRVWIKNVEILPPLSVSQFQLLELLCDSQGRVVPRPELIKVVWGDEEAVGISEQALDALIRRLRDRMATIDPTHAYLITVRGHGLRLDNPTID